MIFGVIEDLIEKAQNGTTEQKEDAKNSLKNNMGQFVSNLEELVNQGNEEAADLLKQLKSIDV
ncbi:MAG: hypothetical protein GF364_13970 [Candidatus Lokiarchaeota archaeon]|nr:hypothetical protein [Candidatus Lokiarchaeota archaeon]